MTFTDFIRGIGAAGSVQHWQCWGQGFKSPMLHQRKDRPHGGLSFIIWGFFDVCNVY